MRLIALALFSAVLICGCSGEPTYNKPTGSGVKPQKNVTGDKGNNKTAVDKIGE